MRKAFDEMSQEAGWDDASRVSVLMDFLESLVIDGKITTDDLVDYADKRAADERVMSIDPEVIALRCKTIVEKYPTIMDPSCTVVLEEFYEENIDHWLEGSKVHVFEGLRREFKKQHLSMMEAVKICQMLFDEK